MHSQELDIFPGKEFVNFNELCVKQFHILWTTKGSNVDNNSRECR